MSKPFQISARAKTNLWLRIVGKREDGFHDIETRMVHLSLADQLTLEWTSNDFVEFTCSDSSLPTAEENLVVKAVRVLEQHTGKKFGIQIHLDKNIPSGAGLGGGSSDAAAVLIAINEMAALDLSDDTLAGLGAQIGSDIPFFVYRKTCDCSGRGEIVRPTADSGKEVGLPIVLLKPDFGISAASAYQGLSGVKDIDVSETLPQICPWGTMVNDLERPVFYKFPVLQLMKRWLLSQSGVHAAMLSGSGSTMLAVLKNGEGSQKLIKRARKEFGATWWAWSGLTES